MKCILILLVILILPVWVPGQSPLQEMVKTGDVARAGDFGYTHGTYELMDDANKVTEHGSYVRIWKKQAGVWRVVLDVTNVHTK